MERGRARGGSGGGRGGGGRGRGGDGGGGPHQYPQQRRGPPSQGGGGGGWSHGHGHGWDQHLQQRGDNTGEGSSSRSGGGGRGGNTDRGRGVGGGRDQTWPPPPTRTWTPAPPPTRTWTPAPPPTRTWTPTPTPTQTQWVGVEPTTPVEPTAPGPSLQPPTFSSPVPVPVPEFQSLKISGTPEDSDRIVPVKRPDKGGNHAIRTSKLRVNHFPVKFNPETVIMHYDVDVKPQVPSKNGRPVKMTKSNLSMIRNKLSSDDPVRFPLPMTAYDGEKNIFSAVSLPTGKFIVEVAEGEDMKAGSYVVTIKLVNQLKLCKLKDYLSGHLLSIPRDILQGMDLVIKENPARQMIPVGRYFFPKEPREDDDLRRGITASRGLQHSLKNTSQGLAMCLDYSVLAFRKRMPVIDFLNERIGGFDLNNFNRFRGAVEKELKGLKVYVNHRQTKQKYTIGKLTKENTREVSFIVEDPEGQIPPRQVRIVDYFRDKYNKDIMYKDIPCLDCGKGNRKNYVPMEFCILVEGQRYPKEDLDRDAGMMLKNMSVVQPKVREMEICKMVCSAIGPCGGGIARNFGMEVNTNMTTVMGRVIGPPELKLGAPNGKVIRVTVDRDRCQWNLVGKSVVEGKRIERWGVLDFSSSDRFRLDPNHFIPRLMSRCKNLGIYMEEPLIYKCTTMHKFSSVHLLRELLEGIKEEAYKKCDRSCLQFILCVMAKKDPGYKYLKWISETEVGIVTQCCLSTPANKANDQYLANLAMKINAKLGGSNVELNDPLPHFFEGKDHVMFIGADVNHPGSWDSTCPSIAAVVATMNWPAANRYAARVCPQHHRTERIMNFGDMCLELVESYAQLNKVRPDKVLVFRDGVSESQFDMALNEELQDLKRAFYTIGYKPTITLIVAQKRHQTRLFPESERDGCSTGNVSPGTVVDTNIVHPFEFDFYLCSHYGSLGTSKPTHYHVLWDDHGFTSDRLQKLIYNLCFTFARCTKPVSLVPPVYYADLVAYRGRMYYEAVLEGQSPFSAASSSSSSSSVSSAASLHGNFYKLHVDLKNIMFFV